MYIFTLALFYNFYVCNYHFSIQKKTRAFEIWPKNYDFNFFIFFLYETFFNEISIKRFPSPTIIRDKYFSFLNLSLNYLLIQKKDSCKFVIALRAIRLYARDAWQYGRWKMMKDASWSSSRQSICRHLRAQVRVSQLLLHGSKIIVVAKI